jgi:phosphoglycolate phosphatase
MQKKLIIFDLDGTLLDTVHDIAASVNYALEQNNYLTHPVESYYSFIGNGLDKMLERALPEKHRTNEEIALMRVYFIEHYYKHSDDLTQPYDGISELLAKLQNEGYILAVASNKVHEGTTQLVERFFPNIKFVAVFGQRQGHKAKPDAGILNEIIDIAGVAKQAVLYVGDSGVDAATAINAGVDFVGVLWGFRPRTELASAGAKTFVASCDELYALIDNNM